MKDFARTVNLEIIYDESYNIREFLRKIAFNEGRKCGICYLLRLEKTAAKAKEGGFDAFSTTLLYSRYQKHEEIIKIAQELAKKHDIDFYYYDFRTGWGRGITLSKKYGMYRQQYCGCVYSERDRYFK